MTRTRSIRASRTLFRTVTITAVLALLPVGAASAASTVRPPADQAASAQPSPPSSCTIEKLPVPRPGQLSGVSAGDPSGRYHVGWNLLPTRDGNRDTLLWKDGEAHVLDLANPQLYAVNSSGQTVGVTFVDGEDRALRYDDATGETTELPGGPAAAKAINENGDIAGELWPDLETQLPVRWPADGGKPEKLSVPDGVTVVHVGGIAEDGTVVGVQTSVGPVPTLLAWTPDGERHELPLPKGAIIPVSVTVTGSTLAASVDTPDDDSTWLWDLTDLTAEPTKVSAELQRVRDVNTHGWVVGGTAGEPYVSLFSSVSGGDLTLPTLNGGSTIDEDAVSVSDDGTRIGGNSADANGVQRAVAWNCGS